MEQKSAAQWLVFTDLDGTLLDHHTYEFEPAGKALDMLKQENVPLIINTSKTFEEVLQIRGRLGNSHPFIAENGSIVSVPDGYFPIRGGEKDSGELYQGMQVQRLGGDRDDILKILHGIREENRFKFIGFEDMSALELSRLTGLTEKDAGLAKQRLSTEPILWQDAGSAWDAFKGCLEREGLQWVQGGRFISISRPYDKKDGVIRLTELYRAAAGKAFKTAGLGDSPNDQGMLDMMTIAVIIASDRSGEISLKHPQKVIRTSERGPKGWQEAMEIIGRDFFKSA